MPGADSPDIQKLRDQKFQVDPTIGARLGEAERTLKQSFVNPAGGYTTPQMRDAILRSQTRELFQQAGAQTRAGQYDVNNQNYARNAFVAGLTAPPLVQTGSTGTSTEKYKTPFSAKIMPAIQTGAQIAAMGA